CSTNTTSRLASIDSSRNSSRRARPSSTRTPRRSSVLAGMRSAASSQSPEARRGFGSLCTCAGDAPTARGAARTSTSETFARTVIAPARISSSPSRASTTSPTSPTPVTRTLSPGFGWRGGVVTAGFGDRGSCRLDCCACGIRALAAGVLAKLAHRSPDVVFGRAQGVDELRGRAPLDFFGAATNLLFARSHGVFAQRQRLRQSLGARGRLGGTGLLGLERGERIGEGTLAGVHQLARALDENAVDAGAAGGGEPMALADRARHPAVGRLTVGVFERRNLDARIVGAHALDLRVVRGHDDARSRIRKPLEDRARQRAALRRIGTCRDLVEQQQRSA